ncbi:MAG: response regulator transcription factor [Bacteroidetes bacterium]|nr:response regulator transcription factor [Bacteroidota bacterium]
MSLKGKRIRAVIIDDEKGCIANLKHHISKYCPEIDIVAEAGNAEGMLHVFKNYVFDVAFLDIEIFDSCVFDLLNDVKNIRCEIVFVTAYEQYAIKAFKVEALDYLLKPLTHADIVDCYGRILKRFGEKQNDVHSQTTIPQSDEPKKVIIKLGEHIHAIKQQDILYLKAKGFYTQVLFTINGKVEQAIVSKPIGSLEKEYDSVLFYRVHKSYLINLSKVIGIVKTDIISARIANNEMIPIAKRRVNDFISMLKQY